MWAGQEARAEAKPVDQQAWVQETPVPLFAAAPGETYVATTAGNESARAFVHLDLTDIDPAALSASTLTLQEASDGLLPNTAAIEACLLTEPFEGSGQISSAPTADCSVNVTASRDSSGNWSVPIRPFAATWTGTDYGLALLPGSGATAATWRVAFDATKTQLSLASATGTEIPGAAPEPTPSTMVDPMAPQTQLAPAGSSVFPTATAAANPSSDSAPALGSLPPSKSARPSQPDSVRLVSGMTTPPMSTVASAVFGMLAVLLGVTATFVFVGPLRRRIVLPTRTASAILDALIVSGPLGLLNKTGGNTLNSNQRRPTRQLRLEGPLTLTLILAITSITAGFVAIALAWDHITTTNQLWVQNQEILSGGIGGLGLIIVGSALLICDRLSQSRAQSWSARSQSVEGDPSDRDDISEIEDLLFRPDVNQRSNKLPV